MTYRCDYCRREFDRRPGPVCPSCGGRLSVVDALLGVPREDDPLIYAAVGKEADLVLSGGQSEPAPTADVSGGDSGGSSGGAGSSGDW